MNRLIEFKVPGQPVGKGRPKFARRGNFVTTYTPEKTASYENLVRVKAEEAMFGSDLINGAVKLHLTINCKIPESWSNKKKKLAIGGEMLPITKPDIDNVVKGLCDAMNGIVWKDDNQVVQMEVWKLYSEIPCVRVLVEEI